MSVYSIKDLEHLSGVKAHTIRIWEQRYQIFTPQRTDTNIRFYSDEDLKLMLNIALLYNNGLKISKIVAMNHDQIAEEVKKLSEESTSFDDQINAMTLAMIDLDEEKFNSVINTDVARFGFEKTMIEIIYPFLKKIGILWITNSINPAQEHFISHLVRQHLIVATNKCKQDKDAPLFLLFLPEGELHELGLLFANFILRSRNIRTIFFGQSVPLNALEEVYYNLKPEYIMTIMTTVPDPYEVQNYVDSLSKKFSNSTVFITGVQVVGNDIECAENIRILNQFEDLGVFVEDLQKSETVRK
jgi:DNA-binding transcriptional MerR regulator